MIFSNRYNSLLELLNVQKLLGLSDWLAIGREVKKKNYNIMMDKCAIIIKGSLLIYICRPCPIWMNERSLI